MTPSRRVAWAFGASLLGLLASGEACRTLEPRAADDDAGAVSSGSSSSGNASSSGSSTSSSGGSGGGSSGSSSSSSSSSGEVLPPFDGGAILPAGDHSIGPNDRLGTLTVPTGYAGEPTPLVLLLHGTGESQASIESYLQFKPTANAKGFFLLRATARNNAFGLTAWNADAACCSYLVSPPDDSGYLRDLVSRAGAVVAVDAKRVYVVGHSSGGFMAYRLACDHADVFAGMVSIAGGADDATTCSLAAPVSVLQVHGTSDTDVAYGGGSFGVGYSYPGAVASVEIWSGYNGCSGSATSGPARTVLASNDTAVSSHQGCEAGGAAELWSISGARHEPSYPAGFAGQLADWLLARPKP